MKQTDQDAAWWVYALIGMNCLILAALVRPDEQWFSWLLSFAGGWNFYTAAKRRGGWWK